MPYASTADDPEVTPGGSTYGSFELDNIYHAPDGSDIHYSAHLPASYDGTKAFPLFITLPGWEGLYFQGVGENLRWERFGEEAIKRNAELIVLAPQLDDWGQTSADQAIALTEHYLACYNVDEKRVYLEGLSGGGETLSLMLGTRPELYTAALAVSSQWDGNLQVLCNARTPLYLFTGEEDSYYGSESFKQTADDLRALYRQEGLSETEIDKLVALDLKDSDYFAARGFSDQHAGGGAAAADDTAMGWLFAQVKE